MKETIRYAWARSSLGDFLIAKSVRGLVALEFGNRTGTLADELRARFAEAEVIEDREGLDDEIGHAIKLIEDPAAGTALNTDLRGSEFELLVWSALRNVQAGETISYGEVAAAIGTPGRAQDVGAACAANRIAIIIPCHRVVKKNGQIAGYRWGVALKRRLLAREKRPRDI